MISATLQLVARRPCAPIAGLLGVLLAGCSSAPLIADPEAALSAAEAALTDGRAQDAVAILEPLGAEAYTGQQLERFKLNLARGMAASGDLWDAFQLIRDFEEEHPFAALRGEIQDLEYEIGERLITSDWRFLFFASDEDDGRVVLEHFQVRYPQHPAAADALRLLGEKAFRERQWEQARERFGRLLLKHPDSEWVPLARFRIAIAAFESLEGPAYDLRSLVRAHNELRDFLGQGVENPGFATTAREALATVREWLGEKHLLIADFYRRVGSPAGSELHLARAAQAFPDTAAGQRAAEQMGAVTGAGVAPATGGAGGQ
ncbi:MAG: outer membrane protein assembly factor BamD [Planctomycetota bacterium]